MTALKALPLLLLSLLAFAACAPFTPYVQGEPTVVWEDAREATDTQQGSLSDDEARRIARAHDAAYSCEATARAMGKKDFARGWQVMRHCILRQDFSDLEILLDSEWGDELARDKNAALLYAHVIAVRGGDVEGDLRLLRKNRLPIYSLQAALAEPESYQGKHIIVRANAKRSRSTGGGREFDLIETKVMAESEWVTAPRTTRLTTKFLGARNDQPGVDIKGRGFTDESTQHHTEKVEVLKNVSVETGREILARMPSGEPGLEPSLDYIVVLKLGKVEKLEDLDGQPIEDVTAVVVDYFEPESGRFARLGR